MSTVGEDEGCFACKAGDAGSNSAAGIVPAWLKGRAPKRTFVADSPADSFQPRNPGARAD